MSKCVYWFDLVSQVSDVAHGPLVIDQPIRRRSWHIDTYHNASICEIIRIIYAKQNDSCAAKVIRAMGKLFVQSSQPRPTQIAKINGFHRTLGYECRVFSLLQPWVSNSKRLILRPFSALGDVTNWVKTLEKGVKPKTPKWKYMIMTRIFYLYRACLLYFVIYSK